MRIDTMGAIAAAAKGRRLDLKLSQAALAERANVSREWLNAFERGKLTVELRLVLRVLDALGLHLEVNDWRYGAEAEQPDHIDLNRHLQEYLRR